MNRLRTIATALLGLALALPAGAVEKFVAGGTVRQVEAVDGDLAAFGGDVVLEGPVKGDALLGGGNVRVRGTVGGELTAGGGSVTVSAAVAGDVHLGGGNVDLTAESSVGGDVSAAGGDVEIRGPVSGSVHVAAGNVLIDAPVGGDVHAASGDIRLGPHARIAGKLFHRGGKVTRDPGAEVSGVEARAGGPARSERRQVYRHEGGGWFGTVFMIAFAALLAGLFPVLAASAGQAFRSQPGFTFMAGFIALICIPAAAVLMAITIIGIPVALILVLLYLLLLMLAYATSAVLVGDAALARLRAQDAARVGWRVGAAMAAMLAIALLARIPILGGVVLFVAIMAGVGTLVLLVRDRRAGPPSPAAAAAA